MPQNNLTFSSKKFGSNATGPTQLDASGGLLVGVGGLASVLNITASTLLPGGSSRLAKISVLVAGSAPGTVYDSLSLTGNTITSEIYSIPNTVGLYTLDWPIVLGCVIVPGTGQTLAVSYSP